MCRQTTTTTTTTESASHQPTQADSSQTGIDRLPTQSRCSLQPLPPVRLTYRGNGVVVVVQWWCSGADMGLAVVVIQDGAGRVLQHALAARSIDISVAGQNQGAAPVGAVSAIGIDIRPLDARAAADEDLVLAACGRPALVVVAAGARAEEEVVIVVMVPHEGALDRVLARRVVGDLVAGARCCGGLVVELDLEDVFPVGAEAQVVAGSGADEIGIDGIIRPGRVGGDADPAVVDPRPVLHGWRRGVADGRGVGAPRGDGVVHHVAGADELNIGRLRFSA